MKNIVLIGMMGSGKSSVGMELSQNQNRVFIDTDDLVERLSGHSIKDIFALYGEPRFRDLEAEVSLKVSELTDHIIATGGGLMMNPKNREALGQSGVIIYLKASYETLKERIGTDDPNRPMMKQNDFEALLNQREPVYESVANYIIEVDQKSISDIVDEIIEVMDTL